MTTTTKNAKAAEKVAILQNLKTNKGGKIEMLPADVESTIWNVLGYHEKNEVRSQNAGYDILENADGDWVSMLGDHAEINLASGETFNLWIVEKVPYYAGQHNLVECGFILDMAAEKGNAKGVKFWLDVIEYKLKNREDAEIWREILKTEYYQAMLANLEIIACIDEYSVDAYAAAEVEIKNAIFAEVNEECKQKAKKRNFIAGVLKDFSMGYDPKFLLFSQKGTKRFSAWLTSRKIVEDEFTYDETKDGSFVIVISKQAYSFTSTVAVYETEEQVQEVIKMLGAAIERGDKTFTFPTVEEVNANILAKKILAEKVAEIKNRKLRIEEIFNLQKDFKKFLKLGEMKRAENVFENIKHCFKAA